MFAEVVAVIRHEGVYTAPDQGYAFGADHMVRRRRSALGQHIQIRALAESERVLFPVGPQQHWLAGSTGYLAAQRGKVAPKRLPRLPRRIKAYVPRTASLEKVLAKRDQSDHAVVSLLCGV